MHIRENMWRATGEMMQTITRVNTIRPDKSDEPADYRRSQATNNSRAKMFPSYVNGQSWELMGWVVIVCMNKVNVAEEWRTLSARKAH